MAVKTSYVKQLLETFAGMHNQTLDYYGFGKLSELIEGDEISQRYLDDLYRKIRNYELIGKEFSHIRIYYLNPIAKAAGYSNFNTYSRQLEKGNSDILSACCGNWWSYVRANHGNFILIAPVRIYADSHNRICVKMQGHEHIYTGSAVHLGNLLYINLNSESEKRFFMVYKLGNSKNLQLLQGVFCGTSSAGDPISGRELLIREQGINFEQMTWKETALKDLNIPEKIRKYFQEYDKNCIKINNSSSFNMNDI